MDFCYCDKHETKSQIGSQIERRLIRLIRVVWTFVIFLAATPDGGIEGIK